MNGAKWLCSICQTEEHFPMMITNCGHTFCEDCLLNVESCPVCRMKFRQTDLQPNYILTSDKQPIIRTRDLETRIKDLVKLKFQQFKSQVDEIIDTIIIQVRKSST